MMINFKEPPIKEGDTIKVHIDSIGKNGDGISIYNKFIIIIPETTKGKEYTIQITKVRNTYAFGKVI